MTVLRAVNAVVMLMLEAAAYVVVGAAGWRLGDRGLRGGAYAVLSVAVLALVWGVWGAPKAARPVAGWRRVALETVWFGAAAVALAGLGYAGWAAAYALVWLADLLLRRVAGQLPAAASRSG